MGKISSQSGATAAAGEPPLRSLELIEVRPLEEPGRDQAGRGAPVTWAELLTRYGLFLLVVALPVMLSVAYYGLIASDRYVSEAKFVVRAPGAGAGGGLSMVMRGDASNRTADDTHAVNAFVLSRDAASELARTHALREVMSRPEGDMFARFPNFYTRNNDEKFFEAYRRFVSVRADSTTGISTLVVQAFRADDARMIAESILASSERFVNRLHERATRDEIAFTRNLVDQARAHLAEVVERLSDYRNQEQTLDPQTESNSRLATLSKLSTEISQLEAGLAQQVAMAPQSPAISPMREVIQSMRNELDRQRRLLVGDSSSMASKFEGYEMLMIERELASRALVDAVVRMEKARQDGQRQSIYLQRVVEPNQPDYPAQPYRLLGIFLITALSVVMYAICRSLLSLALEHRS